MNNQLDIWQSCFLYYVDDWIILKPTWQPPEPRVLCMINFTHTGDPQFIKSWTGPYGSWISSPTEPARKHQPGSTNLPAISVAWQPSWTSELEEMSGGLGSCVQWARHCAQPASHKAWWATRRGKGSGRPQQSHTDRCCAGPFSSALSRVFNLPQSQRSDCWTQEHPGNFSDTNAINTNLAEGVSGWIGEETIWWYSRTI